jgi:hypothetical protein
VSQGTLCLMTLLTALEDESMLVWDVGRRARQRGRGELDLTGSVQNYYTLNEPPGLCSGALSVGEHRLSSAFLA